MTAPLLPLINEVPPAPHLREEIRQRSVARAGQWSRSLPIRRRELELQAKTLLGELRLPESYAGWTMVALASAFWQEQIAAVPFNRRLLLLPHCMRNAAVCPATCDEAGLQCQSCGACDLHGLRAEAEQLGYRVLIAEGSPIVMRLILSGQVDAIVGVACLETLEQTFEKVLLAGIPCMAVPLLHNGCRDTAGEGPWISRFIHTPYHPATWSTRSYLHLMRAAAHLIEQDSLERLTPRIRPHDAHDGGTTFSDTLWLTPPKLPTAAPRGNKLTDTHLDAAGELLAHPLAATEAIALDFLAAGGKCSRPFITLAAYDAMTGGRGTRADGEAHLAHVPDVVRQVALAIEVFHKASLVHDDIEDDDPFRYGRLTVQRQYGIPAAINIGDYLIGLGYRLVAQQQATLGPAAVADILANLADAHLRLCRGQGAELAWRLGSRQHLTPLETLKVYALKTGPAFEAALIAGLRMAGPVDVYRAAAARFSRHLGVAYQIVNDLEDWEFQGHNKRTRGTDVVSGRPTLLLALALEALSAGDQEELRELVTQPSDGDGLERVKTLYRRADAFNAARALIDRHHQRAQAVAEQLEPEPLRDFLIFLLDATLDPRR